METKEFLKSKTIRSLILILIVVVMNMMGIGEAEIGETYDTINQDGENGIGLIMNILMLVGIGGAGYGRAVADKPLGRKKKKNE